MKNKLKLLPLAAAVLFAPAYAEKNNYVGASIGQITTNDFCDDLSAGISCKEEGLGIRGFGGRQFDKYLALEIGYTYAPKAAQISATVRGANFNEEISYNAFDVGVVGRYSFNDKFAVSARIGSAFWDQKNKLKVQGTVVGQPVSLSRSDDGTDLLYGFGAEITPAKSFSIRGEWIRVAADVDVDYISLSAAYRF